jgi:hypothetical protein
MSQPAFANLQSREMRFKAVRAAVESAMPTLLLRRHPNGCFTWKRTNTPWWGFFNTEEAARADAERCGLTKPYVIQREEVNE